MTLINQLFGSDLKVVNIGLSAFKQALDNTHTTSVQVDWKPPIEVDVKLANRVKMFRPAIEKANAEVVKIILSGMPHLIGLERAIDVIPGMKSDMLLHAGPPITWDRMCGPMRGAMIGALLYERKAETAEEAQRLAASGAIKFSPCHEHASVGPMAGIISPSMPVFVLKNEAHGNFAYCTLNEGLGKVLRYGAYGEPVIEKLRWMEGTLYPALKKAVAKLGKIDLKNIIAQALHMGDEVHNRNRAATSIFYRTIAPAIVTTCDRADGRRGSPGVHQPQRSLFPEPFHARLQSHPGRGARRQQQQRPGRHGAQRHRLRHPALGHRRRMVHRSG